MAVYVVSFAVVVLAAVCVGLAVRLRRARAENERLRRWAYLLIGNIPPAATRAGILATLEAVRPATMPMETLLRELLDGVEKERA